MYDYINNLKKNTPIDDELYFRSLQNNTMTFDAFKESQTNFYGAVCYFSRPLFALCSRIDNYVDRLNILENIIDEHGNGNINVAHGNTYKEYLINLGVSEKTIEKSSNHISVSNFYSKIDQTVKEDNIDTAIAMFGIIEDRYTEISSFIAKTVVRKNWLDESKLSHYSTHKELDIHHAELFYKLIEQKWSNNQSMQYIKTGLNLGNELVMKLFNEILIKTSNAN